MFVELIRARTPGVSAKSEPLSLECVVPFPLLSSLFFFLLSLTISRRCFALDPPLIRVRIPLPSPLALHLKKQKNNHIGRYARVSVFFVPLVHLSPHSHNPQLPNSCDNWSNLSCMTFGHTCWSSTSCLGVNHGRHGAVGGGGEQVVTSFVPRSDICREFSWRGQTM